MVGLSAAQVAVEFILHGKRRLNPTRVTVGAICPAGSKWDENWPAWRVVPRGQTNPCAVEVPRSPDGPKGDAESLARSRLVHHLKSAWPGTTSGHTTRVELSHADQIALQRAEGWLELRRPLEASEELDSIEPELRAHPAVLKLRYGIHVAAKQWDMALQLADALARLLPADPF